MRERYVKEIRVSIARARSEERREKTAAEEVGGWAGFAADIAGKTWLIRPLEHH